MRQEYLYPFRGLRLVRDGDVRRHGGGFRAMAHFAPTASYPVAMAALRQFATLNQ